MADRDKQDLLQLFPKCHTLKNSFWNGNLEAEVIFW